MSLPLALAKNHREHYSTPSSPGLYVHNAGSQARSVGTGGSQTDLSSQRSRSRASLPRQYSGSTVTGSPSPGADSHARDNSKEKHGKRTPIGIIGVCALDSKARSKPSWNILNRLIAKQEFEVIVFGDKIILDEEVENWPICNFLISFFSEGFPLDKAINYVQLRKPFCVNDLPMQKILWDRRLCLRILDKVKVATPKRLEVNRDGGPKLSTSELARNLYERTGIRLEGPADGTGGGLPAPKSLEFAHDQDLLIVDGMQLKKPFVEKPVSGENHNINIYFAAAHGGGGRRLFRKINNKSSEKDDSLVVPKCITEQDSSYVYEQLLPTETAEDVKAYTVGPDYCHAETRKSPVVDGLVKRNTHGKEVRYITSLSKDEQMMASKISEAFGQRVCGFDLLRAGGKSYVIDVNGWSFVKDNKEYYDKCASILRRMFIRERQRLDGNPLHAGEGHGAEGNNTYHGKHLNPASHVASLRSMLRSPSIPKSMGQQHAAASSDGQDLHENSSPPASTASGHEGTNNSSGHASQTDLLQLNLGEKAREVSSDRSSKAAEPNVPMPAPKAQWKLKGMVAAVRHADRTPKQKFKFTFHTKPFVDLLKGHQEEVLLVGEAALATVLDAVKQALEEGIEDQDKLKLLRTSLIKKGGWAGTKVQIKPMFRNRTDDELEVGKSKHENTSERSRENDPQDRLKSEKEQGGTGGPAPPLLGRMETLTDVTFSRISAAEKNLVLDKLQLIVKWGGEPTHSARYQAQDLGENLRNELLLMNREALDDVNVFTSSERRVTTSAEIFSSAFLDQKDLPPNYVKVRKDLLDDSNAAKDEMDKVKKKLKTLLREGNVAPPQFAWPKDSTPEPYLVVREVVELMKFHRKVMRQNFAERDTPYPSEDAPSVREERRNSSHQRSTSRESNCLIEKHTRWCCGEDASLFRERWEKLFSEFCDTEKVDPSKVSELYDTMKFDALHNRHFLEWVFRPSDVILAEEEAKTQGREVAKENKKNKKKPAEVVKPEKSVQKDEPKLENAGNDKGSLSQKIGFKRRQEISPAPVKLTTEEDLSISYFNLFSGSGSSVVKIDARLERLRRLYSLAKTLFDYIGPQEYGITSSEKLEIGLLTSLPLLREIVNVLEKLQASDSAKSFFYFTKESHIYTLLNCILEGGIQTKIARNAIPELDYLSHICFELYESQNVTQMDEPESFNYSIRITISPGCHTFDPLDV